MILEYWLANMRTLSVVCATLVAIMIISGSLSFPVFAQTPGPPNPNANKTTAYTLLHQNETNIASTPPFAIKTDLRSYNQGDTVVISGHVRELQNATAVAIKVISPLRNLVGIAQLLPASDGSFTTTFKVTGPLWKDAGNYTIIANYGRYTQANATFYYNGGNGQIIFGGKVTNDTYHLQSGGVTYNLPYIIKNGASVKSMDIYADKFMLEITISAPSDGSLTLTLPRELMDAKVPANLTKDQIMAGVKINPNDLQDANYIVTVNQKLVNQFTETKNPNVRILSIPFHQGDTTIDIIGTMIVPEFGQIAALVLAIAIISIIAVSAKTGLRFMPKY